MFKGTHVEGMLCKGGQRAARHDFIEDSDDDSPDASRVFGSFYHRTDREGKFFPKASPAYEYTPNFFVQDAVEVRIMGGQTAVTKDGGAGNEDTAIVEMDVWVHGCKVPDPSPASPGDAVCGDGVNEGIEQCDLGAEGNGWDLTCSLACTTWNPKVLDLD
jgi:hypothetical protein